MGKIWEKLVRPIMFRLDAERAHELGIKALRLGFGGSGDPEQLDGFGEIERFGLKFANPLGIAAGFDKNGVVANQLAALGFGFVEIGTVTDEAQPGNAKPRIFRLSNDQALINRLGFNNHGAVEIAERLGKLKRRCIVGVNIGKNKDVPIEEATENYLSCFERVYPFADYVAVNVSSPNTANLRELQKAESLEELLGTLQRRNSSLSSEFVQPSSELSRTNVGRKPLLVKVAPDLTDGEIEAIVDIALRCDLSGIIATNTTISRSGLNEQKIATIGAGGLSGRPLGRRSTEVISTIFRYSKGKLPIIGVGGIITADDAFSKIAAGASLIQAYTGFVYGGPSFPREINLGLAAILKQRGFRCIDDAIGCNVQ